LSRKKKKRLDAVMTQSFDGLVIWIGTEVLTLCRFQFWVTEGLLIRLIKLQYW